MAVLFLLLAIACGVVAGDALLENRTLTTFTLFGQSTGGFTAGVVMVGFAALGFVAALLLVLSSTSSHKRRVRRKELRVARKEADRRIAGLERENQTLRSELARRDQAGRQVDVPDRTMAEERTLAEDQTGPAAGDQTVTSR